MNSNLKQNTVSTVLTPPMSETSLQSDHSTALGTQTVKFTIVTPTLNAAKYLPECLKSIEQQRCQGIEIEHLILDGGSTDETLDILDSASVVRVPRGKNDGVIRAMCLGYEAASGDLISFLGADDVLLPGALTAVAETWRREQRSLVLCRSRWTDGSLNSLGELAPAPRWLTASIHASLGWNYLGAANTFITPSLYRELGGFDETLRRSEDYEFFTRCLARQVPFSRVNQTVCLFRRHGDNASLQHDETYAADLARICRDYGPSSQSLAKFYGNAFRAWIYLRNPSWSAHQLRR
ncbi:MAG: glycosyltransferase, partial [Planctomycetales bacterium]|nr:glycosyltransferase [Planctomycetales bacterium]